MTLQNSKSSKGAAILKVTASSAVGLVFLVSGYAKAADVTHFVNILESYGISWLGWIAPLIVMTEILLGTLVLLRAWVRPVSILTILFTVVISMGYTYGTIYKGVTDCGCFGHLDFLNRGFIFTLCRNAMLCLLLLIGVISPYSTRRRSIYRVEGIRKLSVVKGTIVGIAMMIAAYMCGFTFHSNDAFLKYMRDQQDIAYSDYPLSRQLTLSPDSTYLIYVFSFTCPNCRNGIGNIEQYERMGVVDKTIGIALENDEAESRFRELFQPSFDIVTIPADTMRTFTRRVPMMLIIRDDTIRYATGGDPISASFFVVEN